MCINSKNIRARREAISRYCCTDVNIVINCGRLLPESTHTRARANTLVISHGKYVHNFVLFVCIQRRYSPRLWLFVPFAVVVALYISRCTPLPAFRLATNLHFYAPSAQRASGAQWCALTRSPLDAHHIGIIFGWKFVIQSAHTFGAFAVRVQVGEHRCGSILCSEQARTNQSFTFLGTNDFNLWI